jgi:hypothetical protein
MLGANRKLMVAIIAAAATTMVFAAPPPGKGGGGGGSGGGGGGGDGGGGSDYAEMVLIDRDINGVPILTEGIGPRDKPAFLPSPIMFGPKIDCPLNDAFYGEDPVIPALELVAPHSVYNLLVPPIEARYIPFVDGEIPEDYKLCMTEAHLGRLSAVRSPVKVLDMALLELVTGLTVPGVTITTDEAGRLTINYYDDILDVDIVKTIDAPRENLAGFESLLETTVISHAEVNGGAPVAGLPVWPGHGEGDRARALNLMDRAAAMLAAASDKFGSVGLDEVMYVSQMLNLGTELSADAQGLFGAPWTSADPTARTTRYFNFSTFEYDRETTYSGTVCYLKVLSPGSGPAEGATLPVDVDAQVVREPIMEMVFGDEPFEGTNAYGFARAVDDARAVIYWVHEHPLPAELYEYCDLPGSGQ